MILTAHQPAYLPWLGLLDKISKADAFVSWDAVQFCRRDWISRNQIKTAQGPLMLTVPCEATSQATAIRDVRIASGPWARKHMRSFEQAYRNAPHAGPYLAWLRECYALEWRWLVDLNEHILGYLLDEFGLSRQCRSLGALLRVPARSVSVGADATIREVCALMGADVYLFGENGRDYVDLEAWRDAGLEPRFQVFVHPEYPQQHGEFVPRMCAFDLLMNVGRERAREVMR